jgi:hypothetical protein
VMGIEVVHVHFSFSTASLETTHVMRDANEPRVEIYFLGLGKLSL